MNAQMDTVLTKKSTALLICSNNLKSTFGYAFLTSYLWLLSIRSSGGADVTKPLVCQRGWLCEQVETTSVDFTSQLLNIGFSEPWPQSSPNLRGPMKWYHHSPVTSLRSVRDSWMDGDVLINILHSLNILHTVILCTLLVAYYGTFTALSI